jgi:hypothetical protein
VAAAVTLTGVPDAVAAISVSIAVLRLMAAPVLLMITTGAGTRTQTHCADPKCSDGTRSTYRPSGRLPCLQSRDRAQLYISPPRVACHLRKGVPTLGITSAASSPRRSPRTRLNPLARSRGLRAYRRWCQVTSAIKMTIRSLATTIRVCGCNPNDRIRSVIIIFEMKPMSFALGRKHPGPAA